LGCRDAINTARFNAEIAEIAEKSYRTEHGDTEIGRSKAIVTNFEAGGAARDARGREEPRTRKTSASVFRRRRLFSCAWLLPCTGRGRRPHPL